MTALRPGAATGLAQTQPSAALASAQVLDATFASAADRSKLDAIVLSLRAHALLRAGLLVRALVLGALVNVSRRLPIGRRVLVLEAGIYHCVPN
jgi:hypothetical protein